MTPLQWLRFIPSFGIELLSHTVRWLAERPVRIVILALVLLNGWFWITGNLARNLAEDRRLQAQHWQGLFVGQKSEMRKFGALVAKAQTEAIRADRANKVRVQGEVAHILQEQKHGYQADLAAARADYAAWMRQWRAAGKVAASGVIGQAGLSAVPALSTGPVRTCPAATLDDAQADAVTDNTLRLEHIIDAWTAMSAIDVSGR